VSFENPIDHPILQEFDIETLLFPGHTEGHVMFYSPKQDEDCSLLTGDAAMGTTADQTDTSMQRLIRPPLNFNIDDVRLGKQ
jgi:glyoxylase-like metal-dependent hydrolase (beta-lactamase superfamily II)